jgi:hypothetical protein
MISSKFLRLLHIIINAYVLAKIHGRSRPFFITVLTVSALLAQHQQRKPRSDLILVLG